MSNERAPAAGIVPRKPTLSVSPDAFRDGVAYMLVSKKCPQRLAPGRI